LTGQKGVLMNFLTLEFQLNNITTSEAAFRFKIQ